jgi:NADH-quinone oxidoreductase subunit E
MAKFPQKRGALLPALHIAHAEHGWVSPALAKTLAALFEIQPIEVMEVVSFYNMFYDRPQGRHHVYVCTNLPCSLRCAVGAGCYGRSSRTSVCARARRRPTGA